MNPASSPVASSGDSEEPPLRYQTLAHVLSQAERRGSFHESAVLRADTCSPPPFPGKGLQKDHYAAHSGMANQNANNQSTETASAVNGGGRSAQPTKGSRIQQVADALILESQDVLSVEKEDKGTPVVNLELHGTPELRCESTDDDTIAPKPRKEIVRSENFSDPITEEDIREELPKNFYFFLTALNLIALRSVARDFRLKQGYPKNLLVARVFLTFMNVYDKDCTELSVFLSKENEAAFMYFKDHMAVSLTEQEMPSVQHLKETARAEKSIEAPKAHSSVALPGSRALSKLAGSSRSILSGDAERGSDPNSGKKGKRKDKNSPMQSLFVRNMRPRRLSNQEFNKHLIVPRTEKRAVTVDPAKKIAEVLELSDEVYSRKDEVGNGGVDNTRGYHTVDSATGVRSATRPMGVTPRSTTAPSHVKGLAQDGNQVGKGITPSEFARLLVLLKDDEDCRPAFLGSGQVLSRQQIDRGDKSSDFWVAVVEPAFNNKDNKPRYDCSPVLPGVDPSLPPTTYRTGDQLSTLFKSFRSKFMTHLFRYNASGQNSPDFKTFVIESGVDPSTTLGKRIILAGFILGVGTQHPDNCFLSCVGRTIGRSGKAGYDARFSQDQDDSDINETVFLGGSRKAKKNFMSGIIQEKSVKALNAITSYAEKCEKYQELRLAKDKRSEASPVTPRRSLGRSIGTPSRSRDDLHRDKLLASKSDILRCLASARQELRNGGDDDWMRAQWEEHVENLTKRLHEMNDEI